MGRKGVERGVDSTSADLKNLTLNICSFLVLCSEDVVGDQQVCAPTHNILRS